MGDGKQAAELRLQGVGPDKSKMQVLILAHHSGPQLRVAL